MHIIKAFTHLQVQNIPEKYILKRYTRNARSVVPWDRHDVSVGGQNETEQSRLSKLLPKLMRLGRAGSKSDRAYTETIRHIDMITPGIELLRTAEIGPIGPDEATNTELHQDAEGRRNIGPIAPTQQSSDNNIEPVVMPTGPTPPPESGLNPDSANCLTDLRLTEPPVSRTKGRKSASGAKCAKNSVEPANPYSTYSGGQGIRECQTCHVRGHYSTTCPQNPNRSRAAENKDKKRSAKTVGWTPRKRGRPTIKKGLDGNQDEAQSEGDDTQQSGCTMAVQESAAHAVIARIRRATTCHVNYQDESD